MRLGFGIVSLVAALWWLAVLVRWLWRQIVAQVEEPITSRYLLKELKINIVVSTVIMLILIAGFTYLGIWLIWGS